jgi:hypothetical protein
MKTVKTFSNLSEAGFAASLLEAAGIAASLVDELNFMMSYGMATGGIRLQVEDQDYERALRVLESGPDAAIVPTEASLESPVNGKSRIPIGVFVMCGLIFLALVFISRNSAQNHPAGTERVVKYDDNHDGKPDHFLTYRNGLLAKVEVDRNFDGKIDKWEICDSEGRPKQAELDNNFDGRPDEWVTFRDGHVETEKIDTDFNGIPDMFATYKNGIIAQMDVRPNDSAIVVRRYIYVNGVLSEEWVDENARGAFDYKILHDPFGATSERIPVGQPK